MEEYIYPDRKRTPYGVMNFAVIRCEDYYYVDKTRFIPLIEQAGCFFFCFCLHRFGKSLILNVLQHCYDVRTKDRFDALFGDLYIGKHPTRDCNSYLLQGIKAQLDTKDGAVNQLDYSFSPKFNEMVDFTEEVREMLTYYSNTSHFNHSVNELIKIMKPWYNDYCFAQECYGGTTLYNSNMVLYFVKNYLDNNGKLPRKIIQSNIRMYYEKLRMLIRKDKGFAHDASIIQTLVKIAELLNVDVRMLFNKRKS